MLKRSKSDSRRSFTRQPSTGSASAMASLRQPLELLDEFARLEPNWDSYGADRISAQALGKARQLLGELASESDALGEDRIRPYHVAPVADGSVQLEWRFSKGHIEVTFGPEGDASYLLVERDGGETVFEEIEGENTAQKCQLLAEAASLLVAPAAGR